MLTTMRQSIRSLQSILWLVIAAFIVTIFYAWGKGGVANNPQGVLAWVDGQEILYRDYDEELQNLEDSVRRAMGWLGGKSRASSRAKAMRSSMGAAASKAFSSASCTM